MEEETQNVNLLYLNCYTSVSFGKKNHTILVFLMKKFQVKSGYSFHSGSSDLLFFFFI